MAFMRGIIIAGAIVVGWNFVWVWIAFNVDDPVVASYHEEAR